MVVEMGDMRSYRSALDGSAPVFIKHPLETSLSLSLLDVIMSSLILNGIFIVLPSVKWFCLIQN